MTAPWRLDPLAPDEDRLDPHIQSIVECHLAGRAWTLQADLPWLIAKPPVENPPIQGWKLHVSATIMNCSQIADIALALIVTAPAAFKMVASQHGLRGFNSVAASPSAAGKFITIYPATDEVSVELARKLDEALEGFEAPRIMSDRPFRPGSIVHARYGGYGRHLRVWQPIGRAVPAIRPPNGELVPDTRIDRFSPPAWVSDPFPAPVPSPEPAPDGGPRIGEFEITGLTGRSNRGGVYRAVNSRGDRFIIKEARPLAGMDALGRDGRDRLRHEHRVLGRFSGTSFTPRPVELLERSHHVFLVEEELPGRSLRNWTRANLDDHGGETRHQVIRELAMGLLEAVRVCHASGIVHRDLHPGNILIDESGDIRLIDFELASDLEGDDPVFEGGTPGYVPFGGRSVNGGVHDDIYAVGAILFYLATGMDPFLWPDNQNGRTLATKRADIAGLANTPSSWLAAIESCLEHPHTTTLTLVRDLLESAPTARLEPRLPDPRASLVGFQDHIKAAAGHGSDRMWPPTVGGAEFAPFGIAHGTPGVALAYLATAKPKTPLLQSAAAELETVRWQADGRPAGLYAGAAGAAWSLLSIGERLRDARIFAAASSIALSLPAVLECPSIHDGQAGLLLLETRLAAMSGDRIWSDRANARASWLLEARERFAFGLGWMIPAAWSGNGLAKAYPGFGYGAAGIAYALLAAGLTLEQPTYVESAVGVLESLRELAWSNGDALLWPASTQTRRSTPGWINGSAGIGTAFVRAAVMFDRPDFAQIAIACAAGIGTPPVGMPLVQAHGLAGIGEFLIDLEWLLGETRFRPLLDRIVAICLAQQVDQSAGGHGVWFPDQDALAGTDYLTGSSGVATFLARYLAPGPRIMTLDDLFLPHGMPVVPRRDDSPSEQDWRSFRTR